MPYFIAPATFERPLPAVVCFCTWPCAHDNFGCLRSHPQKLCCHFPTSCGLLCHVAAVAALLIQLTCEQSGSLIGKRMRKLRQIHLGHPAEEVREQKSRGRRWIE